MYNNYKQITDGGFMAINSIKKPSVSNQVFEQIKINIIKGEWETGDKIPSETELSEKFGVSRVPIREAIKNLNVLGVLETRHGEGSFVCKPTAGIVINSLIQMLVLGKSQIIEVLEFRRIIEVESARMAAVKASDEDICQLKADIESMDNLKGDSEAFAREDHAFHATLARATKNSLIIQVNLIIADLLIMQHESIRKVTGDATPTDHTLIIQAIAERKPDLAAEIMKRHIDSTIDIAKKMK
jgi:GntR family transcriptional repressor for pyruvate dehydrogenase complex